MTTDPKTTHAANMKAQQDAQAAKLAQMDEATEGLMLVYTGNGKGKSSSAFGVAIRALGWGQNVGVVQFIKGKWITGERQFFDRLAKTMEPERLAWTTMGEGFTWDVQDLDRDVAAAKAAMARGAEMMASGDFDLIVMDEINIALRMNYLTPEEVIAACSARSPRTSVILTGRNAPQAVMDAADLVSEMTEIKHPFQAGIKAKRGIDF
jgi:cob(I)alamin adenosyltransferase